MKLDALTADELEAYENWNCADANAGDCLGIGYSRIAFETLVGRLDCVTSH